MDSKRRLNFDDLVLDFSAINTYNLCGEMFRRKYVEGEEEGKDVRLVEGVANHAWLEAHNLERRDRGRTPTKKRLLDVFEKNMDKWKLSKAEWEDESRDSLLIRAGRFIEIYQREIDPKLGEPDWVEQPFLVEVPDSPYKLGGKVDRTSKAKLLTDYKVVGRVKSQNDVDQSLQLSIYAYAANVKNVAFISFLKKASPDIVVTRSTRTEGQLKWAMAVAKSKIDAIKAKVFPMAQPGESWICSKNWCSFWSKCRGKVEKSK